MAATIIEVAQEAGVSQATAARALGDYGYVGADTRQAVMEAAERLGYRRNSLARALVSGASMTVGLVVGDIENPFFATAARGLADAIKASDYTVLLANSDENLGEEKRAVEALLAQQVDALVVAPAGSKSASHLAPNVGRATPMVLFDRSIRGFPADTVTVRNALGAAEGVQHLISFGHERIGVLRDSPKISTTAQRMSGYRRALMQAGIDHDPALVATGVPTRTGGYEAALSLLKQPNRPTALFTTSNFMTIGAVMAVRSLRLRIPEDVALVGFDDLDWTTLVEPPVTVVAQPVFEIGRAIGQRVLSRLAGDEDPPQRVRLSTELIVRGSCGAAQSTATSV